MDYCLNVLSLSCLQMQECEKDLKFVVFDMYSIAFVKCLNK